MKSRIMVISALFNKPSRETVMKPCRYRLAHMCMLCLDMRTGYAHYSPFPVQLLLSGPISLSWHRIEGHTVTDPSTCVPMCKQVARLSMKSANASPCFKPTATLSQIEAMTQWLCLKLALLLCPRLFNSASLTGFITWSKIEGAL